MVGTIAESALPNQRMSTDKTVRFILILDVVLWSVTAVQQGKLRTDKIPHLI